MNKKQGITIKNKNKNIQETTLPINHDVVHPHQLGLIWTDQKPKFNLDLKKSNYIKILHKNMII